MIFNKKKKITTLICCLSLCLFFSGCANVSFQDMIFGTGEDVIIGAMTNNEWDLLSKREITVLINTGETLLSGSRYVLNGSTPYSEELVDVENAISSANDIYDKIEMMSAPSEKYGEKLMTLQAVTAYKEACIEYASALEAKDNDLVTKASNRLAATINDLVAYSGNSN